MTNQVDGTNDLSEVQSLSSVEFASLAGTNLSQLTTTYTYSENYPSNIPTNVNLAEVASFFQQNAATTPPYLLNPNTATATATAAEYNNINQWWTLINNNSNDLIGNTSFTTVLNTLISKGYLTITSADSTIPASAATLQSQFNTLISDFLSSTNTSGFTTSAQYAQAIEAYLQTELPASLVGQGITAGASFTSSNGESFTIPSQIPTSYLIANLTGSVFTTSTSTSLSNYIANFAAILSQVGSGTNALSLFDTISGSSLSDSDEEDLFYNSLGVFLQSIDTGNPNSPNYQNSDASTNYYDEWTQNAVGYGMIALSAENLTNPSSYGINTVFGHYYQAIYDSYYPPVAGQPSNFVPTLLQFISQQQASSTGFLGTTSSYIGELEPNQQGNEIPTQTPSQSIGNWSLFLNVQTGGLSEQQPLTEGGYAQVQLVLELYDQLLKLLNQIQLLTASQLQMQTFYQEFQNAYTSLETKIPTLTGTTNIPGLGGYGSANSTNATAIQLRSDFSQLQTQFTESVKSFRSEVQQMSSAQNTAVNQSQEAVTQQVNTAQTLIQEFGTILQSIWH